MRRLTNSPQDQLVIELEARKSFAFGVWVKEQSKPVDLSGCELLFTMGKIEQDEVEVTLTKSAEIVAASLGYARFPFQASELDLEPGEYSFSTTLIMSGYSVMILKGVVKLSQNTEFESVNETYEYANPAKNVEVAFRSQGDAHVTLSDVFPPDVARLPPGGATGRVLAKKSPENYDLVWIDASGGFGLDASGQPANVVPMSLGNDLWAWKPIVLPADIEDLLNTIAEQEQTIENLQNELNNIGETVGEHGSTIDEQEQVINPADPPNRPTAPLDVASAFNNIRARWNGKLLDDDENQVNPAPGFRHVAVETCIPADNPALWYRHGAVLDKSGTVTIQGKNGDEVYVRFVAVGWSGLESTPSNSVSITVKGVIQTDLDDAISDIINEASGAVRESVDEYATSISPTVAPTTGWSTTPPAWSADYYVWRRVILHYVDGTTTTGNAVVVTGHPGERGLQGLQGPQGDQGIPGTPGANGLTAYTHIAYADDDDGTGFSQDPLNKAFIGIYVDHDPTDSTDPEDYQWSLIKGADGANGLPGPAGENGLTPYFHTAWADSADGTLNFSIVEPGSRTYLGTYTDYTEEDSTTPADYKWAKIQGPKGDDGEQGPKGDDGADGAPGSDGADGVGVADIEEQYYSSTSVNSQVGGSWVTTPPAWADGRYIWTRSKITYTDSTFILTTPVNVTGGAGPAGQDGSDGADGADGVSIVSVDVLYYLSDSATSLTGGSWVTTPPAWANGKFMWSKTIVNYSDSTSDETDPVCITGAKGETGDTGTSVTTHTAYYMLNATQPTKPVTNPPGGSWTTTEPGYTEGETRSLWSTWLTVYSTGAVQYTDVVKVAAFTAAQDAYNKAIQLFDQADGKLTLSATAPTVGDGSGRVVGSMWIRRAGTAGAIDGYWEWNGSIWVSRPLDETIIPLIAIGSGTYGDLSGERLTADSVDATRVVMNEGFADKFWANEANIGKILVDFVEPNFGEHLSLAGNEGISLLAGNISSLSNELSTHESRIDSLDTDLEDMTTALGETNSDVTALGTTVDDLSGDLTDISSALQQQQLAVRILPEHLAVGRPGSSSEVRIDDDSIVIHADGVDTTTWTGGRMQVEEVVVKKVSFAKLSVEEFQGGVVFKLVTEEE